MEKGVTFQWTPETEEAFQSLKQALMKVPVLGYPQSDGKYLLDTDASNQAIGAVLLQLQDGEEKPFGILQSSSQSTRATILCHPTGVVSHCESPSSLPSLLIWSTLYHQNRSC